MQIIFWPDEDEGENDEGESETEVPETSASDDKRSVTVAPDKKSATIFGLRPSSLNYAQIAVMNGQNDGTPSDPISFWTKEGGILAAMAIQLNFSCAWCFSSFSFVIQV